MESPRKKRGRGRPRVERSEEEIKAARAEAWKKYQQKKAVDVDSFRKKIILLPDTYEQWRTLKEKANMHNDDGFARLLMKCFSEHIEEYVSIVDFFRKSGSMAMFTQAFNLEDAKVSKEEIPKTEIPKRKRGRPPGKTSIYYVDPKERKIAPAPAPPQQTTIIVTKAPDSASKTITSTQLVGKPTTSNDDPSNLSPSVRSARLAFSKALAQSFSAMASPERTVSAKRNLIASSSGETIAVAPTEDGKSPQEVIEELYDRPSMVVGVPPVVMGVPPVVMGAPPVNNRHLQDESDQEPSQRLMIGEYTVGHQDSVEDGYSTQSSVLYGDDMGYGDEEIQSLQEQPEPQISSHAEAFVETNGSSHIISEPGPSIKLEPGAGLEEDSVKLVQPLEKNDSKFVRVPDPSRRSRLNQITGGLLNRLQKRAMSAEPS